MAKCQYCNKEAKHYLKYSKLNLCTEHLIKVYEKLFGGE